MKNNILIKWIIKKNVSTNDYYKSHWSKRSKLKDSIIFNLINETTDRITNPYQIYVRVNNRLDLDNNSAALKVIIDHCKTLKWIPDDNPKFLKRIVLEVDTTIQRNLMIISIEEL